MAVDTLYPDFGRVLPRDGSVEIHKDYHYFPDRDLYIGNTQPLGRLVLTLQRLDPITGAVQPLGLFPGQILRIPCIGGYGVRAIRRVTVNRIVELESSLNMDPIPGHQVLRVKAYSQKYIDMRLRDLLEKRKIHFFGGRYIEL